MAADGKATADGRAKPPDGKNLPAGSPQPGYPKDKT
jgi:hypothetical protein